MKIIVEILEDKKIILKKLDFLDIKLLKTRKKIKLLKGVDTNSNYVAIFVIERNSRFITKDALELEELFKRLVEISGHNYKKKILLFDMPFCSKAKERLKELKWRIIPLSS